ncbi:hypothetical protein H4Q26_002415 [Puccinia striiformis f. sp. tritici PST-130]|nr:hypothetical protein H4Q26_002415 [Puccinia striiformis f. sp. tritici PST-130]
MAAEFWRRRLSNQIIEGGPMMAMGVLQGKHRLWVMGSGDSGIELLLMILASSDSRHHWRNQQGDQLLSPSVKIQTNGFISIRKFGKRPDNDIGCISGAQIVILINGTIDLIIHRYCTWFR